MGIRMRSEALGTPSLPTWYLFHSVNLTQNRGFRTGRRGPDSAEWGSPGPWRRWSLWPQSRAACALRPLGRQSLLTSTCLAENAVGQGTWDLQRAPFSPSQTAQIGNTPGAGTPRTAAALRSEAPLEVLRCCQTPPVTTWAAETAFRRVFTASLDGQVG